MDVSEPSFTPGPWAVEICHQGEDCWCRIICTAESAGTDELDGCIATSGSIHKRNAHLIAAAPELYETLARVWDAYGFDPSIDSSIWQDVQAALRKARGQ